MKDTRTIKIILPEENYTFENSNEIFVNASEIIEQIKISDCSEDITKDYELASATFHLSKRKSTFKPDNSITTENERLL